MGIFKKMADSVRRFLLSEATTDDFFAHPREAAIRASETSVLALSSAWACSNLLAGTIGSMPLFVYENDRNGNRQIARNHPLYNILHSSPNFDQTALDFWEYCQLGLELRGNCYAKKVMEGPRIAALIPIDPASVSVRRLPDGSLEYAWSADGVSYRESESGVLHIRGFGGHPLGGMSTLQFGCQTFGLARAINDAANSSFENELSPSGVISFPEFIPDEKRDGVRKRIQEDFVGARNRGKPLILEKGSTFSPISMKPEEAQMLESRGFSVEEVCRFFGVPPFMIGHTEKSTSWGTGIEQQTLAFQKFTLRRRLARIEQALMKQLLTPQDRARGVTIEFSVEGLLRGDSAARASFYQVMTQIGALTINEVRALENKPPIEGGDVPRIQMQNVPINEAGGNDVSN